MRTIFANDTRRLLEHWVELANHNEKWLKADLALTIEECLKKKADCYVIGINLKDAVPKKAMEQTVEAVSQLIQAKRVPVIFISTLSQSTMYDICEAVKKRCGVAPVNLGFAVWEQVFPRLKAVHKFGAAE